MSPDPAQPGPVEASGPAAAYPPAPWAMHGSLWLTLFWVGRGAGPARPRGLWGAAFVTYDARSPLSYSELLVARLGAGMRGTITDIWVDSPASMAGGRALWAIPKGLADFDHDEPAGRWSASRAGATVATASYADHGGALARRLPAAPFVLGLCQPALPEGVGPRRVAFRGRARMVPMGARWELPLGGPLGFLAPARQLASVRLSDFAMTFG